MAWRKVADALVHSALSVYPIPFLLLQAAIEGMADEPSILAPGRSWYLNAPERKIVADSLVNWARTAVVPQLTTADAADFSESLTNKTAGLLQRTFRHRFEALLDQHGVTYDPGKLATFVQRRNATHGAFDVRPGDYDIWSYAASCIEQVLLRRLGYHGEFIDRSTRDQATRTM